MRAQRNYSESFHRLCCASRLTRREINTRKRFLPVMASDCRTRGRAGHLRRRFPGMIGCPSRSRGTLDTVPFFGVGAPQFPAQADTGSMPSPDLSQPSATTGLDAFRAILTGNQSQPQRPPITTPTGQIAPGATKSAKTGRAHQRRVMGRNGRPAANEQMVAMSGGRRSGGVGVVSRQD